MNIPWQNVQTICTVLAAFILFSNKSRLCGRTSLLVPVSCVPGECTIAPRACFIGSVGSQSSVSQQFGSYNWPFTNYLSRTNFTYAPSSLNCFITGISALRRSSIATGNCRCTPHGDPLSQLALSSTASTSLWYRKRAARGLSFPLWKRPNLWIFMNYVW